MHFVHIEQSSKEFETTGAAGINKLITNDMIQQTKSIKFTFLSFIYFDD